MLGSLQIKNVPIKEITDKLVTLPRLETLSLMNCSLTQLPNLSPLSRLSRLFVPNNRLSKIEGLAISNQLWLSNNLLTEIPSQVYPEKLMKLSMGYNPVRDMAKIMSSTNIREILLSNTEISAIPENIQELSELINLDLSKSKLTSVPKSVANLTKLRYLSLMSNPLSAEEIDSIKKEISTRLPDVKLSI